MTIALVILLAPLLLALPFASRRRRSLALLAMLVAGFGGGALVAREEGRTPAVNLAILALLLALFRLAGAFESKAPVPENSAPAGKPGNEEGKNH